MINSCINCRVRRKKGQIYFFCIKKKAEIDRKECFGCNCREIKKTSKMTVKKRIKPISKKRVTVSKKTYNEVFNRCNGKCAICGTSQYLEYHHVFFRSERPDLIDNPDNGLMLCGEFANNCHKGKAHKNKKYWQPILLKMIDNIKK